jgi:basic membrane protein A
MRLAFIGVVGVLSLLAVACGDDDNGGDTQGATGTTPKTCTQKATDIKAVDFNGDGKLVVGVATPGPRNDGAYYQTLVDCVNRLVAANNGTAIIVDNIPAADAATQIENLVKQNVDIMMVGASEIGKSLPDLSKKYSQTFWYCNCGAGQPVDPNYAQSQDDGTEISYVAGYATGLLMKDKKKTKAAFIGNNNLNFEVAAFESFKLGLKAVDASYDVTYYATGSFNDVPKATEAYNTAKGQGIGAVYPYLGGAHEAVVKLANKDDIITMSAGSSAACSRTDLKYQIAVKFDGGDYLNALFTKLLAGQFKEGAIYTFHVGVDPEPGAQICKASTEQQKALDTVASEIAAGKYKDALFAIQKKAYNF